MEDAFTTIRISVIVSKGSSVDWQEYRHTALWLEFPDLSPSMLVHVVGSLGLFKYNFRELAKPEESKYFAKLIVAGTLTSAITQREVLDTLGSVPIANDDLEFNCQTWVELALRTLRDKGTLSKESYEQGFNGMIDATLEAKDPRP